MGRGMIAWLGTDFWLGPDAELPMDALGSVPANVTLVDSLCPEVQFAAPGYGAVDGFADVPALEVVQVRSAGVEWIAPYLPDGVKLCSARGVQDQPVAEWVLWAILADRRQALAVAAAQATGHWDRSVRQRDVAGCRVVILGLGSIGREVARLLNVFGAEVTGVARRPREDARGLDALPTLLPQTDVLVNLLPLTTETAGLVNESVLAMLPDGALVVNAGRGGTQDTDALLAELRSGRLRATLDVADPEPLPEGHPLWTAPGLTFSPHQAGDTPGSERGAWMLLGDQLRRWAAGDPLQNIVSAGY